MGLAASLAGCGPPGEPPRQAPAPTLADAPELIWQERFDRPSLDALGWISPSEAESHEIASVFSLGQPPSSDGGVLVARHDGRVAHDPPPAVHFGRGWDEEDAVRLDQACGLSWRWRVDAFPAQDDDDPWLDLAASVYVIVDLPGLISSGEGFKFGWLQRAPQEAERQFGLVQIPRRVASTVGAWHVESVDLCALYREHYGEDPAERSLLYVGVVTDADNTESIAAAAYDDFAVTRLPPAPR